MPKIKVPKSSPSIDMTPMVDLAFLLVTFFMLAATFREEEVVPIDIPMSTAETIMPENVMVVSIDAGGRVFMGISGKEARLEMLDNVCNLRQITLTEKQKEAFSNMPIFGCSLAELPAYLDMSPAERKKAVTDGIPCDSTHNELDEWVAYGSSAIANSAETFKADALKDNKKYDKEKYDPKYILKVDNKTLYVHAKTVIDTFRKLELLRLNFITSFEKSPLN